MWSILKSSTMQVNQKIQSTEEYCLRNHINTVPFSSCHTMLLPGLQHSLNLGNIFAMISLVYDPDNEYQCPCNREHNVCNCMFCFDSEKCDCLRYMYWKFTLSNCPKYFISIFYISDIIGENYIKYASFNNKKFSIILQNSNYRNVIINSFKDEIICYYPTFGKIRTLADAESELFRISSIIINTGY